MSVPSDTAPELDEYGHDATYAADPSEHHGDHPSDAKYVGIAIILGIMTAAEVSTYFFEEELGITLVPFLLILMTIKFWMVASYFMHLRFDSRIFSRIFYAGLILAVVVYCAMLATFSFWSQAPR